MSHTDERLRILKLVENKQITAEEAGRLLETIEAETARSRSPASGRPRSLRVLVTDLGTRRQKVNVTIPVTLVDIGLKLGARLFPRPTDTLSDDIRRAISTGETGRVFDMQEFEESERIEIFLE
jgi:hypothetical protein